MLMGITIYFVISIISLLVIFRSPAFRLSMNIRELEDSIRGKKTTGLAVETGRLLGVAVGSVIAPPLLIIVAIIIILKRGIR